MPVADELGAVAVLSVERAEDEGRLDVAVLEVDVCDDRTGVTEADASEDATDAIDEAAEAMEDSADAAEEVPATGVVGVDVAERTNVGMMTELADCEGSIDGPVDD
jgi:hypothetical protein